MTLHQQIPIGWRPLLAEAASLPAFAALDRFVAEEREIVDVYPPEDDVFTALETTPYESVKAVIVGQDPYHAPGQANGLAFSVLPGQERPPSLRNIVAELERDLGHTVPRNASLISWARHGVLLLNRVLTVRKGRAASHRGVGWEEFTGHIVSSVAAKPGPIVFLLWGREAQTTQGVIHSDRHIILCRPHPSPRSAWRGFRDSAPFLEANAALESRGLPPIDWDLGPSQAPESVIEPTG